MTPSPSLTGCMDDDVGTGATRLGSAVSSHTPLPWKRVLSSDIFAADGSIVGECSASGYEITPEDTANADLIVRAVNNHQKLVDALELILPLAKGYRPDEGQTDTARATCDRWIAAAEEALSQVSDSERSSYVPTDGDNQP